MKLSTTAAALAVTASVLGAGATAAQAATTTCTSSIKNRSVNSIVVPAGSTCRLVGVKVSGGLTVEQGASLTATRTTVKGTTSVRPKAVATFDRSSLRQVTAFYADAVTLKRTTLAGLKSNGRPGGLGYDPQMPNDQAMYLRIISGSRVNGDLTLHGTRLGVSHSTIAGNIRGGWNHSVSVRVAKVNGNINLSNFREGAFTLCDDIVAGDVAVSRGNYGAFIGQVPSRGVACGGNSLKGDLSVNEMLGVRASNNTVSGLASGTNPAWMGATGVIGSGNRFLGGSQDDFALAALRR